LGTISEDRSDDNVRKLRVFSSIRTKFALTYFLVVAVALALMNTYFLMASRDMIFSSKQVFVQSQASLIATHLEDIFETLSVDDDVYRIVAQLDVARGTHIVITDTNGVVLYDPAGRSAQADFPIDYIREALEINDIFYAKFSNGSFTSSAFTPVISRGLAIGAVYVNEVDTELGTILIDMQTNLKYISVLVAVFSVVVVALIIWSVMRRVTSIMNAVKSVREGEYSYRISMGGSDELALLSDEFNSLTNRLHKTDEVRRRFVADASHELRTPLASIRLLSDSILQNEGIEYETVQEFISDIGHEAERLARTTEKLMSLSRLDSAIPEENTRVDMRDAVMATLRMLMPLADSSGIKLDYTFEENCYVLATDDAIHQIVFNLVENAIKYSKPDGSVFVRLNIEDKSVVLTVDDRGIGVPVKDLPHIFDRFYRVDKARSREAGGSGLGLSIVWDTVRDLNGKITATRREGGGMRFQVRFSLYD